MKYYIIILELFKVIFTNERKTNNKQTDEKKWESSWHVVEMNYAKTQKAHSNFNFMLPIICIFLLTTSRHDDPSRLSPIKQTKINKEKSYFIWK